MALTPGRARTPSQEALAFNVIVERARHRFSQAGLARRSGVSRTTIGSIERCQGYPTLDVIERIANAFGVPIAKLFEYEEIGDEPVGDDELARLVAEGRKDTVDAWDFMAAVDEAAGHDPRRYSRAGRPRRLED